MDAILPRRATALPVQIAKLRASGWRSPKEAPVVSLLGIPVSLMGGYSYYEFRAVDCPLSAEDQADLRQISTRARINARSFVNHYNWGDLRGWPIKMMLNWFDLYLHWAPWYTREFMVRLPKHMVDRDGLNRFSSDRALLTFDDSEDFVVLHFWDGTERHEYEDLFDSESAWLNQLAPVREELLRGDLSALYLAWLSDVGHGFVPDDAEEPLSGLGPLSDAAGAFAEFFCVDTGLIEAASQGSVSRGAAAEDLSGAVRSIARSELDPLLVSLAAGDPHAAAKLRRIIRARAMPPQRSSGRRTAGQLRAQSEQIWAARKAEEARREEAERKRREREKAEAHAKKLAALRKRGEAVWDEVEESIQRRNKYGYDDAAALLSLLQSLAQTDGTMPEFWVRMEQVHSAHGRKHSFIRRLRDRGILP